MLNSASRNAWLLATLLSVFLFSCVSFKPSASRGRGKLYETFYVGEYGTQYFIEPLAFKNPENKASLFADFTFRYKDQIKDSVVCNFSIISQEIFRKIDSINIGNEGAKIAVYSAGLLYNEKVKKNFLSRFTVKFSLLNFTKLFLQKNWGFEVFSNNESFDFKATPKTRKSITKLDQNLFVLLR